MSENKRFDVRLDIDAQKEYDKLDNSVLEIVNKQIDELEFRADEVGKPLTNNNSTKLAGCREIKLKEAGIRIVYRVTNIAVEVLRIVYVLAIEERSKDFVFKVADKRNKVFKQMKQDKQEEYLKSKPKWEEEKIPATKRTPKPRKKK